MSTRARAGLGVLFILACWGVFSALPAAAAKASEAAYADAKRFKLDQAGETVRRQPGAKTVAAVRDFRRAYGSSVRVLFHPRTGAPEIVTGFAAVPRSRDLEAAARDFLDANLALLGVRTADLKVTLKRGKAHILFQQTHEGVPVEFSRIGVHLDGKGRINYVQSEFDPGITASPLPLVGEAAARDAAGRDAGGTVVAAGSLVYLPVKATGETRLAWKFRFGGVPGGGKWVYYIDAQDGKVLLRYDDLRYQTLVTSGTITGGQFPINPFSPCTGVPTKVPFPKSTVWLTDSSSSSYTDPNGFYSFGLQGRVFALLRGPNVVVTNEKYANASYDNGAGEWYPFTTAYASPNPYPANANLTQIVTAPSEAVRVRTHFSKFSVGEEVTTKGEGGNFDDDEVQIEDGTGARVASYFGNIVPFLSAEAVGRTMTLRLVSNDSLQSTGYEIDVSSYFAFTADPTSSNTVRSTYDLSWSSANTADSTWDELNVFYHLNAMHDVMAAFGSPTYPLDLDYRMPATVHHSNGFQNAFYDSERGDMYFGDGVPGGCVPSCGGSAMNCSFALDTTVVRHEYTHFVVDRIYPIENFGEFGAISEGMADYFSASSLDHAKLGEFVVGSANGNNYLRNLDDGIGNGSNLSTVCTQNCSKLPGNWTGEIHEDSQIISQVAWAVRQAENASFPGQGRGDQLVYRTLFYFPGSFREFREAMLQVDLEAYGDVGVNPLHAFIEHAFTVHGVSGTVTGEDLNEPNDGSQTATDISAVTTRTGSIYPLADMDWYHFPGKAGTVQATLTLPQHNGVTGEYLALGLTLTNANNDVLAFANAKPENFTLNGNCPDSGDCWTGDTTVTLTYKNATPGPLYLGVACGNNDFGSIGGCFGTDPYTVTVAQVPDDPQSGSGMNVTRTGDLLTFSMPQTTFAQGKKTPFSFDATSTCLSQGVQGSARLRDHNMVPLYDTDSTSSTVTAVPLQTVTAPTLSNGVLTGSFRLHPGTAARYPAVGTMYLEILGVNAFCERQALGVSQALGFSTGGGGLTAFNNVMNPAKGDKATLRVTINGTGHTTLKLYTLRGELIKTLLDRSISGSASVDWDGRNERGTVVASGVYLAHVDGPGANKTQKIVVVK